MAINRDQWQNNLEKGALTQTKQPQTQKNSFPIDRKMPKIIDRTKNLISEA
jgi:hypothetical protein